MKWVESGDTRSLTLRGMLPAFLKGSSRLTNWPGVQERDRACVQDCACECVHTHTCTCNCISLTNKNTLLCTMQYLIHFWYRLITLHTYNYTHIAHTNITCSDLGTWSLATPTRARTGTLYNTPTREEKQYHYHMVSRIGMSQVGRMGT